MRLVNVTRAPEKHGLRELEGRIQFGASPRASIVLSLCARANAFLSQRSFVTPADIKRMAPAVLRHRIQPSYEAEAEGLSSDDLIACVLETVRLMPGTGTTATRTASREQKSETTIGV